MWCQSDYLCTLTEIEPQLKTGIPVFMTYGLEVLEFSHFSLDEAKCRSVLFATETAKCNFVTAL